MPMKRTKDAIFTLKKLLEENREDQKKLNYVFVNLQKGNDRIQMEELWFK